MVYIQVVLLETTLLIIHVNDDIEEMGKPRSVFGPSPCRAAAHSKLGNYTEATGDCERAIRIDPSYSKAYGRMG